VVVVIGGAVAAGCSLPPASPTPVDPAKPTVTMTVRPGTVTVPAFSGNQFLYSACFAMSNPRDGVHSLGGWSSRAVAA
jgi:hypothetical protein